MTFTRRCPIVVLAMLTVALTCIGFCDAAPKKSKSTEGGWTKIGSFTGYANSVGKMLEFKPSQAHWRFTINTAVSEKAGPSASAASVRIGADDL